MVYQQPIIDCDVGMCSDPSLRLLVLAYSREDQCCHRSSESRRNNMARNRLHTYYANRGCGREKEIEKHGQGGQRREKKVDTVTQPVRRERHGWDPAGA